MTSSYEHFGGKSAADHLREARRKGALASAEIHGTEMPGHMAAAADATRETTIALLLIWVVLMDLPLTVSQTLLVLIFFSCGWFFWKVGRSATLGWARLERLHRLIEEERWEIQHHRGQEREELTELYRAKGFEGKLLEEVIDVLMADDNRLLRVMLEEELGLTLEAYEHPLKQSFGAGTGAFFTALVLILSFWINPYFGLPIVAFFTLITAALIAAKHERNRSVTAAIWNVAIGALSAGITYFIIKIVS